MQLHARRMIIHCLNRFSVPLVWPVHCVAISEWCSHSFSRQSLCVCVCMRWNCVQLQIILWINKKPEPRVNAQRPNSSRETTQSIWIFFSCIVYKLRTYSVSRISAVLLKQIRKETIQVHPCILHGHSASHTSAVCIHVCRSQPFDATQTISTAENEIDFDFINSNGFFTRQTENEMLQVKRNGNSRGTREFIENLMCALYCT